MRVREKAQRSAYVPQRTGLWRVCWNRRAGRWPSVAVLVVVTASLLGPGSADAQDIEALAAARGVQLPEAYYRLVERDPTLFEFERGLFNRFGRLDLRTAGMSPELALAPNRLSTSSFGEVRIPVILALFADSPAEPHITSGMVRAALFDEPAPRGTITQAYEEISRGQLTVLGDVSEWVRSSLTMTEVVGTEFSFGEDNQVGTYLVEALTQVDDVFDFTQYDNDGPDGIANSGDDDGYVDVVTFEFLEVSASCGGPAIWPHRSSLEGRAGEPFETNDVGANGTNILVQDYITQSAADCTGQSVQDAGVITHEFGHALGLPDWYHWIDRSIGPAGRRWVMGCWALMAAGSWGCGPVGEQRTPFGPSHMIGYSKHFLGWLEPIEIGEVWNQEVVLGAIQTTGEALRIQLDAAGDEFLHIEYRGLIGFDRELPAAGVLMYKQDSNAPLRPDPATRGPYFLQMLEQDANESLRRITPEGGSRGEPGDAWGVGGVVGKLNAETASQLRLGSGRWTTVAVHEVSVEGDQARLVISTGRTPMLIAPTGPFEVEKIKSFELPVRVAGGRGPYGVAGALPDGFSLEGLGDEVFVVGSVRDEGPHEVTFAVQDSDGGVSAEVTVTFSAPLGWSPRLESLLQHFLESEEDPLTRGELDFLDEGGNGNGGYDVGDLRAWLRSN